MTDDKDHFSSTAFARGPQNSLLGPLDDSVDVRVNLDRKIVWMKEARQRGFSSLGDFVRMTVEEKIQGQDHLVSMFVAMLGGNGANVGQATDGKGPNGAPEGGKA